MFLIGLYSTCSTSYLLVGINRIHLITGAGIRFYISHNGDGKTFSALGDP
jgi:hypothetical protein